MRSWGEKCNKVSIFLQFATLLKEWQSGATYVTLSRNRGLLDSLVLKYQAFFNEDDAFTSKIAENILKKHQSYAPVLKSRMTDVAIALGPRITADII